MNYFHLKKEDEKTSLNNKKNQKTILEKMFIYFLWKN